MHPRRIFIFLVLGFCLFRNPSIAQDNAASRPAETTANPMAALKDEVARVLNDAGKPFTEEQERAISLMMEDRRQASEQLFGDLMDFRDGPTRGQENDRLRDAISWMRTEFLTRLRDLLTAEQIAAWVPFERATEAPVESPANGERRTSSAQTQYVRINNNAFTAEDSNFRFGRNFGSGGGGGARQAEVIQRGGQGSWHGNMQVLFKDEALNARNPFAHNKPPYQERQVNIDFSGPLIPGRLTSSIAVSQSEAENVDTVHATLPEGLFDLGVGKPQVQRGANARGTYQFSDAHSLSYGIRYSITTRKNQNIGGFTLPERASDSKADNWNFDFSQFSRLSARVVHQARFEINDTDDATNPLGEAVQINVLDAFRRGGAQNRAENNDRNYIFGNLYERLGEKLTFKAGTEGVYRKNRSFSKSNFTGSYTFSSLASFLEGKPLTFRINQGDPLLAMSQFEVSIFTQNDFRVTPQLTLMLGARYEAQTNLRDRNNIDPRLGIAYALGRATVIRSGAAIFHQRMQQNVVEFQRRLDGTRQFEIVIDNPSYPDPFQEGTLRKTYPSVRVTDPNAVAPYNFVTMISFERTLLTNFLVNVSYDWNAEIRRLRLRNLNAPLPSCVSQLPASASEEEVRACRPDPGRGNILNLEATGREESGTLRASLRQRFSIFNVTANYSRQSSYADSLPPAAIAGGFNNNNSSAGLTIPEPLPADNYNLAADWGRNPFPLHTFGGTVNARLPLGVFLTGSVSTNSGRYWTITTGTDDNRDSTLNDRPPGGKRYTEDGPNQLSFAFNISKAFFLSSANPAGGTRANMNVFANMTNAFNRVNRGQPSGVMTSPNFGKSISAIDPREIEAGVRFQF
jgi:hypothetical protein